MGRSSMHLSLVPRHDVGEKYIFTQTMCALLWVLSVRVCCAYVHTTLVLDKRKRNGRVSCFPALSAGLPTLPAGQRHLLRDHCLVVSCPSRVAAASLPPPSPSVHTVVPGPGVGAAGAAHRSEPLSWRTTVRPAAVGTPPLPLFFSF